jgi:hypothetical protein
MTTPTHNTHHADGERRAQTWAGLLAVWAEFARRTGAIPDSSPLRPLKAATPDIIALQAICFALADILTLPAPDRPAALDLASTSISRHSAALRANLTPLPEAMTELIDDAERALGAARAAVTAATVDQP